MKHVFTRLTGGIAARRAFSLASAIIVMIALFVPVQPASAATTFTVNTTSDTADAAPGNGVCADGAGNCSLRAAIMESNVLAGADTINLPAGTYTLMIAGRDENDARTGDLDILGPLTISGAGPQTTIIQAGASRGNGIDKVMSINPYLNSAFATTIQGVTLRYGTNTSNNGMDNFGGALDWDATGSGGRLIIDNCIITDNIITNGEGGGLFLSNMSSNISGVEVRITRTTLSNNQAMTQNGGGVMVGSKVPFTIEDSIISGNIAGSVSATKSGGGLYLTSGSGTIVITRTVLTGNQAWGAAGDGGGIYSYNPVNISQSLFSGNTAGRDGAGLWLRTWYQDSNSFIANSTFSGNQATGQASAIRFAMGAYMGLQPTATLNHVTIAGNTGPSAVRVTDTGQPTLQNTIVSGNGGTDISGSAAAASQYNLVGTCSSCGLVNGANGNQVGVTDPRLLPLGEYGGPTQTRYPMADSPAIDRGTNLSITIDQRGAARPADYSDADAVAQVDIGAVEANPWVQDIANQNAASGSTLSVPFSMGDAALGLTATAVSSNTTILPNDAAHLSITNPTTGNPTLVIKPVAGQSGKVTITVTANATMGSASDSFELTVINPPDLTITKTHTGNFFQGQAGAAYTITVTNTGGNATSGTVSVEDTLPAGLTVTAMSGTGWACIPASAACNRSDSLAAGSSYPPITLVVNVSADAPASLTNIAGVNGGAEMNTANNTASDPTTILPGIDLRVSKNHSGSFRQGQAGAQYTLIVSNTGSTASNGTVTLTDTLPGGLTATDMVGSGWTCMMATLTCTRADSLAPGGSYPPVTVMVNVASNAPASLTNTAQVSGGGEAGTSNTNNSASDPTTIIQAADLILSKAHTGSFTQGLSGAYTLIVSNIGPGPTVGTVTVTDSLPAGLTATGMSGTGWSCTFGTLTCTRSDTLTSGANYPAITLTVDVAANAGSNLMNTADVSGGGELNTSNNSDTDATTILPGVDLTIAKSHTGSFTQGQAGALYTLTVTNAGTGVSAGTVTVTDTLPAGLTATGMSGTGWACALATLTCTRADLLLPGASYPGITLTVTIASDSTAALTNQAAVSGGGEAAAKTGNNTASDPTTITQLADLVVAKNHTGSFRQGQAHAEYTLVVSNSGRGPTTGVVSLVDTLPSGLTAESMTGTGWSCVLASLTCSRSDALAAGASYPPVSLMVTVADTAPVSLTNSASVSGGGEVITGNNTDSDPTTIIQAADLTLSKAHSGGVRQGGSLSFTLTVTNSGPGATVGTVTVSDDLPSEMTPVSISGTGWSCVLASLTCTRSDVLAASASYPVITLTVDAAEDAPASLTNHASVSGGGELNTGNNAASDTVAVTPVADLTVSQTHAPFFLLGETGATFTITVTNTGPGATTGTVTLEETALSTSLTPTAMSGSGWNCVLASLTCTRADALAPGASYPLVTLSFEVSPTAPETVGGTAQVSGGGELNNVNNNAPASVPVYGMPVVTLDPENAAGCPGCTVSFWVVGEGRSKPDVRWQVSTNGGESWADLPADQWVNSADGSELTVLIEAGMDGYLYHAVLTNEAGSVSSAPAELSVYEAPTVTPLSSSVTTTDGSVVTLAVTPTGTPAPELQWQVSTDGGKTWADVTGETGETLSFTANLSMDGYRYRVTAINDCGSVTSQEINLRVVPFLDKLYFLPFFSNGM